MIDTHCHLTHPKLRDDAAGIVDRALAAGLSAAVTIGTGVEDAEAGLALRERHPGFLHLAAGIDPFTANRVGDRFDDQRDALEDRLRSGSFCALGEIGLDYHYDLDPRPVQEARFREQLEMAVRLDLPVVVHVREAHRDMIRILGEHLEARGVIHSFTAGPEEAAAYLDLGWHLGFNGVLTFRNAEDVRVAAAAATADRIVVETDSPYLAPEPLRGRRCEPALVVHTLRRLAEVRGEDVEELDRITTANAAHLFGIQAA